jgi:DNA-binding Xre family transcriptional regulator
VTLHTLARLATVLECTPTDLVGNSALPMSDERRC